MNDNASLAGNACPLPASVERRITAPPAVRRNGPSPRRYHASSGKCAVAHDEFRELAFVGRKLGEVGLGNWKGEQTAIVGWRENGRGTMGTERE